MNLVKGIKFKAEFPIFTGSYTNAKFSHTATVEATITKESYGADKGQHTFTFLVTASSDEANFAVGKSYRKKGRNMYPNIISIIETPTNYAELAEDKSRRAAYQSAAAKRGI